MKKTWIGLFLIIASIASFGLLRASFGTQTKDPAQAKEVSLTRKFHGHARANCLLVGDSRVFHGLDPAVFEKELGDSALNLGFDSAGFGADLFQYVEEHFADPAKEMGDPQIVIFGISPNSFTLRASYDAQLVENRQKPASYVRSVLHPTPIDRYFRPISIFGAPSIKQLLGMAPPVADTRSIGIEEKYLDNGFSPIVAAHPDPTAAVASYRSVFQDQHFSNQVADEFIKEVESYNKEGVRIFAVRMPVSQPIREIEDELSGFPEKDVVERFTAAGGTWIPLPRGNFETFDGSHLTGDAAVEFSKLIAENVKGALVTARKPANR